MNTPHDQIRLLLTDDQALFREGLRTLLSLQPDFAVNGEAANGQEAIDLALTLHPDIVLMDLNMPVLDGVAATRRIREALPGTRVLVLTTFDDDEMIFDGLRAGASGYLLKDTPGEVLFAAIRAAHRGESFLPPAIAAKVVAEFTRMSSGVPKAQQPLEALTEREREILKQLATGASNKEIAAALFLTEGTVKNYVTVVLGKLGVRDRTQAALKARELGLL
jgi:DNA-binding NarL/FixJ family response regulator